MAKTVTDIEQHLKQSQDKSFAGLIFEFLSERAPTEDELKIFELILNLSVDHGPDAPSAVKTIEAAKTGKSMGEAVGAGLAKISDSHGGAMKPAMEIILQIKSGTDATWLVKEYLDNDKRIAGFGHRVYKDLDPRAELIIEQLEQANLGQEYIHIARGIETTLEQLKGQKLVLNIDGAIALALLAFNWKPELGPAVFIISRAVGLSTQFLNNNQPAS